MAESDVTKINPDDDDDDRAAAACPPDGRRAGPPREAGGTTGDGNLAPMQAPRTGGATSGVSDEPGDRPARAGTLPPDA